MGGDLTEPQLSALGILAPIIAADFYLAGGVAVALRLHHRRSRDLDLFAERDPGELDEQLTHAANVRVTSRAPGTIHLETAGVPVSLLRYRYPLLRETEVDPRVPVRVASPEDLIAMKLSAIGGRGARRDFWDLHELLAARGCTLAAALELFGQKYPNVDRGHVLRALAYFGDADSEPMPSELLPEAWQTIKRDFQTWVAAAAP